MAATLGAVLPLIFARLKIDPAVATGPFVTTAIDLLGILLYFGLAASMPLGGAPPAELPPVPPV